VRQREGEDWSARERFLRYYLTFEAVGGILTFLFWGIIAVVLLVTGPRWLGSLLLVMLVGACGFVFAIRRRSPRNPRRHKQARRRRSSVGASE
jgi:hypothetical protein